MKDAAGVAAGAAYTAPGGGAPAGGAPTGSRLAPSPKLERSSLRGLHCRRREAQLLPIGIRLGWGHKWRE